MDVLIVVYISIVYLIEVRVKLTSACFSLWTNYYFIIESIHVFSFSFVNNVVYQALSRCGKLGYKILL